MTIKSSTEPLVAPPKAHSLVDGHRHSLRPLGWRVRLYYRAHAFPPSIHRRARPDAEVLAPARVNLFDEAGLTPIIGRYVVPRGEPPAAHLEGGSEATFGTL
ncbi:hypothetical protein T492DRAFT_878839 [Pavlovales sp. CCMP2436]|nr:hypothetical protein T492DRAFT_878839 [Pavlovales sp. CCMP2436]